MGLKTMAKKAAAPVKVAAANYGGLTIGGISVAGLFGFLILIIQQLGPIWGSMAAWQQVIILGGGFLSIIFVLAGAGYLILFGRKYGINPVQAIKDLKDILDLLVNSGVLTPPTPITPTPNPTPIPVPTPAPNPVYPLGVTIGLYNLGKGNFIAALIDVPAWKATGGRIEVRNWGDNEPLYTILVADASVGGALVAENQAMYRLEDNTVVSIVPDPFATKNPVEPNDIDKYNAMVASDKPLRYFLDNLVPAGTDMILLRLECSYGIERAPAMHELYKQGNASLVNYVNNVLPGVIENMANNDAKANQLHAAQDLYGKYIGKVPSRLRRMLRKIMR